MPAIEIQITDPDFRPRVPLGTRLLAWKTSGPDNSNRYLIARKDGCSINGRSKFTVANLDFEATVPQFKVIPSEASPRNTLVKK